MCVLGVASQACLDWRALTVAAHALPTNGYMSPDLFVSKQARQSSNEWPVHGLPPPPYEESSTSEWWAKLAGSASISSGLRIRVSSITWGITHADKFRLSKQVKRFHVVLPSKRCFKRPGVIVFRPSQSISSYSLQIQYLPSVCAE